MEAAISVVIRRSPVDNVKSDVNNVTLWQEATLLTSDVTLSTGLVPITSKMAPSITDGPHWKWANSFCALVLVIELQSSARNIVATIRSSL